MDNSNPEIQSKDITRRTFLKASAVAGISALGALGFTRFQNKDQNTTPSPPLPDTQATPPLENSTTPINTPTIEATLEPTSTATPEPTQAQPPLINSNFGTEISQKMPTKSTTETSTPQPTAEPVASTKTEEIDKTETQYRGEEQEKGVDMPTVKHLEALYKDKMLSIENAQNSGRLYDKDGVREFFKEIARIAYRLNPNNPNLANQIAAVINFESGFSTWIENPSPESDATGLIQFMGNTANSMGVNLEELKQMTPLEQLQFVELYLKDHCSNKPLWTIADVYMTVLYPVAVGEKSDFALFSSTDGTPNYLPNSGLDINQDESVTKYEASKRVVDCALENGEVRTFLYDPRQEQIIRRRIEEAGGNMSAMESLIKANSEILANPPTSPPGWPRFGNGLCLWGVNLSVQATYPDYHRLSEINGAAEANTILEESPDYFQKIKVSDRDELYALPPGTIIVYERNTKNNFDAVNGVHYGHISIVLENDGYGNVKTSSDHTTTLTGDLANLESRFSVFVPIKNPEGFVPIDAKNNIKMVGYENKHIEWARDELSLDEDSNFKTLIQGLTFYAGSGVDSVQEDKHTVVLGKEVGKDLFGTVLSHESGHVIYNRFLDLLYPRIKEAYDKEGPLTAYSEIGYHREVSNSENTPELAEIKKYHEAFADLIALFRHKKFQTSLHDLVSRQPNPFSEDNDSFPLYRTLAHDVLKTDMLLKQASVFAQNPA